MSTLEQEIASREEETATLRTQLAGMEGTMREKHEARINNTQAQVSRPSVLRVFMRLSLYVSHLIHT